MTNAFDYFEKIYCINLKEDTKKWKTVQLEFDRIGIKDRVERFEGIKREKEPVREYLGCNLSHIKLIEIALQQDLRNILIFEDDTQFLNWNESFLLNAISALEKEDWRLFRIGYNICDKNLRYNMISENLIKLKKGSDVRSNHAYAIHCRAFSYFLEKFKKVYEQYTLDQWYSNHFDFYCLIPLMSVQNQFHPVVGYKPKVFMEHYARYFAR